MTDEEQASQPGAVATRAGIEPDVPDSEPVFSPLDFRLNLGARLAETAEPLPNLDSPAIRHLTWEHVVGDRPPPPPPPVAATTVPLPPPSHVPSPPAALPIDPPVDVVDEDLVEEEDVVEQAAVEQVAVEEVAHTEDAAEGVAEADMDRLASVPDLIEDDSPVELPTITPSRKPVTRTPISYIPVLAEHQYVAPVRPAPAAIAMAAAAEKTTHKLVRKKKRHPFRSFVTLVALLGVLGGGAYAARKYLLDQPTWSGEVKPLADDVATARGLQFKVAVEITEVTASDYANRLAGSTVDASADPGPVWRALGLLNGELDLEAIGRQAMIDLPAFYDPSSKSIFVTDGLKAHEHLYRFAMHRALTTALLDQEFDWSSRVLITSPAAALGIRATIDGDALVVANSLAATDAPEQLALEVVAFTEGRDNTPTPSPYATAISGRAGVTMSPTILSVGDAPEALAALEQTTPSSDGVLDPARPVALSPSPPGTHGMMFWYYVLASRLDDSKAWSAAAQWTGDSLVTSMTAVGQCVDAKVEATSADGAAALLGAFQSWAASAPAESTTTVNAIDGNQIAIRACDPSAAVTGQNPAKVPVVFGGAAVEQALVQAAIKSAGDVKLDKTCLVKAARQRGAALTAPADDAPVLTANWEPAYAAANLDLAFGCLVTG